LECLALLFEDCEECYTFAVHGGHGVEGQTIGI
jgi:hypothetical protein